MSTNADLRIPEIAKALCQAAGRNPHGLHGTGNMLTRKIGTSGTELYPEEVENWLDFVEEAKRFVIAFDILKRHG